MDNGNFIWRYVQKYGGELVVPPDEDDERARDLWELDRAIFEVLTLDQQCEECGSGTHAPPFPDLFVKRVLESLGWLTMASQDGVRQGGANDGEHVDRSAKRDTVYAALPAYALLTKMHIAEFSEQFSHIGDHHAICADVVELLLSYLPDDDAPTPWR